MGWIDHIWPIDSKSKSADNECNLSDFFTLSPELVKVSKELQQFTPTQSMLIAVTVSISFAVGVKAGRMHPPWKRFTNVQDIPSTYFGGSFYLRGRCLTVSDGDTIRFLHAPTILNRSQLSESEKASANTLPIRVCTIDTPETAKFGKPGQPYGETAKDYLSSMLENRIVYCRMLQKDQYGRAVAEVRTGPWPFYRFVDEKMLTAGLAEVYLGSGAVYGHKGKDFYLTLEEKARRSHLGMWKDKDRESAAAYKARLKT